LIAAGAQIEAAGDKLGERVVAKVELRRVIGGSGTADSVVYLLSAARYIGVKDQQIHASSPRASGFLSSCSSQADRNPLQFSRTLAFHCTPREQERCGDMEYDERPLVIVWARSLVDADHPQRG
jgi:hypothetical protein